MQSQIFRQALENIRKQLKTLSPNTPNGNILFGIAGYVASGKSRLFQILLPDVKTLLGQTVIYLPFDLWINEATVSSSSTYAGKFLLDDLAEAIKCIKAGKRFLVPRYDIVKTAGVQNAEDQLSLQQLTWNKKSFVPCTKNFQAQTFPGSIGLYIEIQSRRVYSLFPALTNTMFIVDGTLIFPKSVVSLYDTRVFVQAVWPLRVARMIRRFNRREVFGTTSKTMEEYVSFLVDEARSCADNEIHIQADGCNFVVESIPDTLSNYLDLAYLRWYITQPGSPQWVTEEEVDISMRSYIQSIKNEHDVQAIKFHRRELIALMESKHLLVALENIDELLTELATIVL